MGIIVLIAFWVGVVQVWIELGPKVPLVFIALWLLGLFGFPYLGLSGYLFMTFQAILAITLLIIAKYQKTLNRY